MDRPMYPVATREIAKQREEYAPEILDKYRAFSKQVFLDGALPSKTKELIAVAVAHVTQCPWCIRAHTTRAKLKGANEKEIMEAIWVAAEMRAGAAVSHSALAIDTLNEDKAGHP
ncbi:MAG: carboxymuconolactone decarboxylase family protein [Acidobacteriaceae bacterium]